MIQVWDAKQLMPTAGVNVEDERKVREDDKADIVEVVKVAGQALTRKEIIRARKLGGKSHGSATVAKTLADLTAAGDLVNPKDKKVTGWLIGDEIRRQAYLIKTQPQQRAARVSQCQ